MIISNSLQAERSVLSTLLDNNDQYDVISNLIAVSDFESVAHQSIFKAIVELAEKNQPHDLVMVADLLETQSKDIDFDYINKRLAEVSAAPIAMPKSLISHVELIRDKSQRRKSLQVLKQAIESLEGNALTDDVNNTVVSAISNLEQQETTKESYSMDEMPYV